MGHLFPHMRPFVDHIGYNFTIMPPMTRSPAIARYDFYLYWRFVLAPLWSGIVMMAMAITIAQSRVCISAYTGR